jgi:hypothetical protein
MTYIALADLKLYLGLTEQSGDDALLLFNIDRAQKAVESRCKRIFEATADTTRYFDAIRDVSSDLLTLYLDHDLCSITTITNGDSTTVTSNQYVKEPRNYTPWYAIRLLPNSGVAWTYTADHENAISITGKWAYATAVPDDIAQACLRLAAWFYRQKDNSADGSSDRPIMTASGATLLPSRMPTDFLDLTEPYIRRNGGG